MYVCTIKICGLTLESDVEFVGKSGAEFIGLLVDMPSQRSLSPDRAARLAEISSIPVILLFFDKPAQDVYEITKTIRPAGIQLQGHETRKTVSFLREKLGCEIWKGVHLPASGTGTVDVEDALQRINIFRDAGADRILLDTMVKQGAGVRMGGTGKTFDWDSAAVIVERSPLNTILAGGLKPENVAEAIRKVKPYGVDLASGVESSPGVKDHEKVAAFVKAVRDAQ